MLRAEKDTDKHIDIYTEVDTETDIYKKRQTETDAMRAHRVFCFALIRYMF